MKILITGCNGFIGKYLYKNIKSMYSTLGIDLIGDPDPDKSEVNISIISELEKYLSVNTDIDIIIHAAALAHNKGTDLSFKKFKQVNFEGTKNLIDLINKYLKLKKFIFFSTISVYGEKMNKDIYYENDECNPKTPYAVTKRMSEDYLKENANFPYTILRFAPVYNGEFYLNIDRRTILKNRLYRVGKGENRLSLLNIDNIVNVIKFLINNPDKCNNNIFNIADDRIYTFNDLIDSQLKRKRIKGILRLPRFIFFIVYYLGKVINNNFLVENSIKLLSDNIYSPKKISEFVSLDHSLDELVK